MHFHGGFSTQVATVPPEYLGGKGSDLSVRMAGGLIWESVDKAGILLPWEVIRLADAGPGVKCGCNPPLALFFRCTPQVNRSQQTYRQEVTLT